MLASEAFTAGIEHGGLTTEFEIRILICYLLEKIGQPMTFGQMNDALQSEGLVNYFEYAEAVAQLTASGHLVPGEGGYALSDLGRRTALTFERDLPLSVREKAVNSARQSLLRQRIERENRVETQKVENGYLLTMRICDGESDLMRVSLFVPTEQRCRQIRERFLSDPTSLYRGVVALLLDEEREGAPTGGGR